MGWALLTWEVVWEEAVVEAVLAMAVEEVCTEGF